MSGLDRPRTRGKRARDLSVIAPVFGFLLLVPPVIGIFGGGRAIFGAPAILVYLFGVWLALIAVAAILSRALGDQHDT